MKSWLRRIAFFARLATVFFCLQFSGGLHGIVDVLEIVGLSAEGECDDDDCAPGCPSCHCPSCCARTLPACAGAVEFLPPRLENQTVAYGDDAPPCNPDLPHVYRPPRSSALFA